MNSCDECGKELYSGQGRMCDDGTFQCSACRKITGAILLEEPVGRRKASKKAELAAKAKKAKKAAPAPNKPEPKASPAPAPVREIKPSDIDPAEEGSEATVLSQGDRLAAAARRELPLSGVKFSVRVDALARRHQRIMAKRAAAKPSAPVTPDSEMIAKADVSAAIEERRAALAEKMDTPANSLAFLSAPTPFEQSFATPWNAYSYDEMTRGYMEKRQHMTEFALLTTGLDCMSKLLHSIRSTSNIDVADAIGELALTLITLCSRRNLCFDECIHTMLRAEVAKRSNLHNTRIR